MLLYWITLIGTNKMRGSICRQQWRKKRTKYIFLPRWCFKSMWRQCNQCTKLSQRWQLSFAVLQHAKKVKPFFSRSILRPSTRYFFFSPQGPLKLLVNCKIDAWNEATFTFRQFILFTHRIAASYLLAGGRRPIFLKKKVERHNL